MSWSEVFWPAVACRKQLVCTSGTKNSRRSLTGTPRELLTLPDAGMASSSTAPLKVLNCKRHVRLIYVIHVIWMFTWFASWNDGQKNSKKTMTITRMHQRTWVPPASTSQCIEVWQSMREWTLCVSLHYAGDMKTCFKETYVYQLMLTDGQTDNTKKWPCSIQSNT